jgi:catechol 2,3-dioxygenase-like lactoylglutathione lyase family enzyme
MRILGIDHIVLRSAQAERLVSFYCDVLGCSEERRLPAEVGLVQLRAGAALIDIVSADSDLGRAGGPPPGADGGNLEHFCLRVEPFDPAAISALLAQAGCRPESPQRRYGADGFGLSVYLRDPDGNRVELKGPAEKSG